MADYEIVTLDSHNIEEHGFFCVKNRKHAGYVSKRSWLERRFEEGLGIKLVQSPEGNKAGFIEYAPAEVSWRVIEAPGYLVIHCLWVASNKFPYAGMASALLQDCIREARFNAYRGVAVVTSDGPWMARRDVFLRNGFEQVDEAEPYFQLLAVQLAPGPSPEFPADWEERLRSSDDLRLLYTDQCPFIGKAALELPPVAEEYGIRLRLVEFDDPTTARKQMPSPYGVIGLVYKGRLLADHPISATRFRNILEKELKMKARRP